MGGAGSQGMPAVDGSLEQAPVADAEVDAAVAGMQAAPVPSQGPGGGIQPQLSTASEQDEEVLAEAAAEVQRKQARQAGASSANAGAGPSAPAEGAPAGATARAQQWQGKPPSVTPDLAAAGSRSALRAQADSRRPSQSALSLESQPSTSAPQFLSIDESSEAQMAAYAAEQLGSGAKRERVGLKCLVL